MSRSKKWRLEWAFFLGENGRRQYNKLCKGCVHPCKQSFRAVVLSCPHYLSRRSKKCRNQGMKFPQFARRYVNYVLPFIIIVVFIYGYLDKFL